LPCNKDDQPENFCFDPLQGIADGSGGFFPVADLERDQLAEVYDDVTGNGISNSIPMSQIILDQLNSGAWSEANGQPLLMQTLYDPWTSLIDSDPIPA
jgi:hypothetical protein